MTKFSILGAMFLALASCQTTSTPSRLAPSGAGAEELTAEAAISLFQKVCIANYPSATRTRGALYAEGFRANSRFQPNTFYDGIRSASFNYDNATPRKCSMLFRADESFAVLRQGFASLASPLPVHFYDGAPGNPNGLMVASFD